MKKLLGLLILMTCMLLQFCGNKAQKALAAAEETKAQTVPKLTYEANVAPLIASKCGPCHVPPRGNKKPYVSFASVSGDIDDIIRRVSMTPGSMGFMPFKSPQKLSDSAINVLVQWKADGMLEK